MAQNGQQDEQRLALFIDFENIAIGVRDAHYRRFDINLVLERLLDKGTAYITDLGMTGPYDSVLGRRKDRIIKYLTTGLPAPFACKGGVCATCRAKVTAGEVSMKVNYGLSEQEIAEGYVLTCQATPLTEGVALTYDV